MAENLSNNSSSSNTSIDSSISDNKKTSNKKSIPIVSSGKVNINGAFKCIFIMLLGVTLIRLLVGSEIPTLSSLLEFLSSSIFIVEFPTNFFVNWGDWGFFNFFKEFLMTYSQAIVFVGTGIINLIGFFIVIVQWIFL